MIECDIAHRRSVSVLWMLYKVRFNQMHPLYGALPGPYVPVRVTRCALIAHRYTYLTTRCRTSQFCRNFYTPLSVPVAGSCSPCIRWYGTGGFQHFQEQGQCFSVGLSCSIHTIVFCYFSLSLFSVYRLVLWGWGL